MKYAYGTGAFVTQLDSTLPGPADVIGGIIIIGTTVIVVGLAVYYTYDYFSSIKISTASKDENTEVKVRNPNPPAKRERTNSKKEAYERAKRAGKGKEPIHHPNGKNGPHYHPDVEMPKNPTPKVPNPHDHYYYPRR